MSATTEHVARKARRCGGHPCERVIEPGARYRRHVAFPGDEGHESGTSPWVIEECWHCVNERAEIYLQSVRNYYNVPAYLDTCVIAGGKPGRVWGGNGHGLMLLLEGDRWPTPWHPSDVRFLAGAVA